MQSIIECPICHGKNFTYQFSCVDHTVSHETFQINKCDSCGFLVTSPRPDADELGKYYLSDEYVSHSKHATTLFDKLYKLTRHFTIQWKFNLVIKNIEAKNPGSIRLLDVGCGTGEFLKKCKENGFKIAGVEPSETARAYAVSLLKDNIEPNLDSITGAFDVITLWHVLEHIPDLNAYIENLRNRLNKNGTMFIAVPNHKSEDARKYKNHWAAYDVPRHLWHFNKLTIKRLLQNHSLSIEKVIPMKLDAVYVSMLSQKKLNNFPSPLTFLNGLANGIKSNLSAIKTNEYSSLIYVVRK
jgi:2-polyprenyl-3-methyl-5-hydroxy-6-metoxy-1,4-benzoquinol methylase